MALFVAADSTTGLRALIWRGWMRLTRRLITGPAPPEVAGTVSEFRALRRRLDPRLSVGFVPTMGALHPGHISLMRRARKENDLVIVSIFVNPTQFGPNEDFSKYPRQPEEDLQVLAQEGVRYVFAPTVDNMYGPDHRCYVVPEGFDVLSEGKARPGHFRGVATVVTKLLNVVQPQRAYFGQKDAMQCVVLRRLINDLNMPVEMVVCPTVREADGLALSSRNAYLNKEERAAAPVIYRALQALQKRHAAAVAANADVLASELREIAMAVLKKERFVQLVEYVSIGSRETMEELSTVGASGAVVSVAVRLGKVRLIDNVIL